jgi:hypothetical protein
MKSTLFKPAKCEKCPFFERVRSPSGTHYNCRYYNKGTLDPQEEKFSFCRVESIFVAEGD